jgi:NAD(P)H-dependent flavin oxidoreductase YrpB (nitropropane dioxygenase family)
MISSTRRGTDATSDGTNAKTRYFEASAIGTMAPVPQMVDAVAVPVIASGGIRDGRGVAAALAASNQALKPALQSRL